MSDQSQGPGSGQVKADTGHPVYRVWPRRAWLQTIAACLVAVVLIVTVSSYRHPSFHLWSRAAWGVVVLVITAVIAVRPPQAVLYETGVRIRRHIGSMFVPGAGTAVEFYPVTKMWGAPSNSGARTVFLVLRTPVPRMGTLAPLFWSHHLLGNLSPADVDRELSKLDHWLPHVNHMDGTT